MVLFHMISESLKKIFTHRTDKEVDAIMKDNVKTLEHVTKSQKKSNDQLSQSDITLQIFIATGGRTRHGN